MSRIQVEICCGSAEDVIEAEKGGADRVELNSNLFQGGLTPTVGELIVAKAETKLPIMTMVRPREAGFFYSEIEYKTLLADAERLLEYGSDGLVFGFLSADGEVDPVRTKKLVEIAAGKPTVFHRAFDVVPDWRKSMDTLVDLGVTRILTSGQEPNVFFATDTIREMIDYANGRIEILPGAGITLKNAGRIIAETGADQIHLACHKEVSEPSVRNNRQIFYGGALYPAEDRTQLIDAAYVKNIAAIAAKM